LFFDLIHVPASPSLKLSGRRDKSLLRGGTRETEDDGDAIRFLIRFTSPPPGHPNFRAEGTKVCCAGERGKTRKRRTCDSISDFFPSSPPLRHSNFRAEGTKVCRAGERGKTRKRRTCDSIFDPIRVSASRSPKLSGRRDESLSRRRTRETEDDGDTIRFLIRFTSPPLHHSNFRRGATEVCCAEERGKTRKRRTCDSIPDPIRVSTSPSLKLSARSNGSLSRGGTRETRKRRTCDSISDLFRHPRLPVT